MSDNASITKAYELAREHFARDGIDTEAVLAKLDTIPVSMHCWQGDDVKGFENPDGELTGGIQVSTIPAGPAMPTSCAPTSTRRCR